MFSFSIYYLQSNQQERDKIYSVSNNGIFVIKAVVSTNIRKSRILIVHKSQCPAHYDIKIG